MSCLWGMLTFWQNCVTLFYRIIRSFKPLAYLTESFSLNNYHKSQPFFKYKPETGTHIYTSFIHLPYDSRDYNSNVCRWHCFTGCLSQSNTSPYESPNLTSFDWTSGNSKASKGITKVNSNIKNSALEKRFAHPYS